MSTQHKENKPWLIPIQVTTIEINHLIKLPRYFILAHNLSHRHDIYTISNSSLSSKPFTMLAARDQENLVHGQQALAASKPLNQGTRAAPPKTPGNRYPKTPLKIPLHDENAPTGFGKKSVLQTKGKGNENLATIGKKGAGLEKNAFITPMGMAQKY